MEQKDNLAIVEAVKTMEKLLKKYGYTHFNAGITNVLLQETAQHGKIWYGAYSKRCRIPEDKLVYPTGKLEYEDCEQIEQENEVYIKKLESDYSFICSMAAAKIIVDKLTDKSTLCSSEILKLTEQQSKLETYCENVLDSYAEAGISPLILKSFALNQNSKYADTVEELKMVEEKVLKLDKKNVTLLSDSNKLKNAISTIETNTYLKYADPEDGSTCVRHTYQVNVDKIQDKQSGKLKV